MANPESHYLPLDPPDAGWHTVSIDESYKRLQTEPSGLTEPEALRRLDIAGLNRLAPAKRRSAIKRLLMQFNNLLLYIMLGSAVITALLQHWIDTGVLLAAVVINAIVGFIQEGKAESALDGIRTLLSPHATVLRDGRRYEIDAEMLAPGDLVILNPGDRVPADLRLVAAKELRIEEAALTGESLPVEKNTGAVASDVPLGDRACMAYSGTVVTNGQATGIVIATGPRSEIGKINRMLSDIRSATTPLMRQIDRFSLWLAMSILCIAAITFLFGIFFRDLPASEMFIMVVALVASAIPEGLPAIMTVTLALGVQRMARRKAIVRHLPAVEALGSVTVICTDKTGTLTRNEMTVQRVICAHESFDIGGVGYIPEGVIQKDGRIIDASSHTVLAHSLRGGVLCNDGALHYVDKQWKIEGDPTEGALLVLGRKAGFTQEGENNDWPRLDSIPFESANCYMATQHRGPTGDDWVYIKGAPERIIGFCNTQLSENGPETLDVDYWRRMATDTAARGLRLLALACKKTQVDEPYLSNDSIQEGFVMLALVGIVDLPREEAIKAVQDCHNAGIRVKMITGDHADTARAIGTMLNIGVGKPAMTGNEIAMLDEASLASVVSNIDVFARASPEHKLRLVQALQQQDQVVAMTGDGVNDAPALKRADIGVSMGLKGTEAAKEASDMVLADDNFATIANAVREGRAVYDNVMKFILFMLPTNGGEALIVIASLLLGLTLPLTPAQVLWINMVTVSTLGLALAFEPPEPGIMTRRPRSAKESMFAGFFVWRIAFVSVLMMTVAVGLFTLELRAGNTLESARTMAVNAVVISEMFYLINSRHITTSVLNRDGLLGNRYVLAAIAACALLQLLFTYNHFMQYLFGSTHLDFSEWSKVVAAGLCVFLVAEAEKLAVRGIEAYQLRTRPVST